MSRASQALAYLTEDRKPAGDDLLKYTAIKITKPLEDRRAELAKLRRKAREKNHD